jgi:hypothetical protein
MTNVDQPHQQQGTTDLFEQEEQRPYYEDEWLVEAAHTEPEPKPQQHVHERGQSWNERWPRYYQERLDFYYCQHCDFGMSWSGWLGYEQGVRDATAR